MFQSVRQQVLHYDTHNGYDDMKRSVTKCSTPADRVCQTKLWLVYIYEACRSDDVILAQVNKCIMNPFKAHTYN